MKKYTIIFVALLAILVIGFAAAEDLSFPVTEDQIAQALSLKDKKIKYKGVTYESKNGRVFKVIGGKRYRLRGLQIVETGPLLPKAGALINFEFDSSEIDTNSFQLLDEFGKVLKIRLPEALIILTGHTDSKGSDAYNQELSERRAQSVAQYLMTSHGIKSERLLTKGMGEKQPIAVNTTEENRRKNRRVEFIRVE
jgi:outer membrane protein OmpA-like peptidoglycan-associated protein